MAEQGWSLRRLARALGVSYETVRRWQLGEHRPYPAAGQRLALILGEPLDDLMAPQNDDEAT